jgi:hypothetical protein
MPDKGWHRTFDDPIPVPGGGELRTLRDAGNYIANCRSASTMHRHGARRSRCLCFGME